jgi:glycosyltransferase involved in cell wall biosynthesis
LEDDPDVHIVYGHLEVVNEDGSRIIGKGGVPQRSGWPEEQFNWFAQMAHLNQLPSCCMMRRAVLERSGGYRERMVRNEDAEFWCRVTSLGFRAKKFTQAVTYFHRHREDSKGAEEWKKEGKEPDWTAWFPWRMGATEHGEARKVLAETAGNHPDPALVPFGAQGRPSVPKFWYIHDHAYPVVSVIVTCGPMHEKHLLDALDSLQAQSYPDWECIVVNDTGKPWEADIMGAPFAKVVNMEGNQGVAAARNKGYEFAKGKFIVWMDADDYWLPWYLNKMVGYAEENDGIIFSDLLQDTGDELKIYRYPEFDERRLALDMRYAGSSVLVPRHAVEKVIESQGGWDTEIVGMEDWDYQIAVHDAGVCAYHIDEALFVYRVYSSTKREKDHARIKEILEYLDVKWKKYRKDGEKMGCGCGKKIIASGQPQSRLSASGNFKSSEAIATEMADEESLVMVEYSGPNEQNFSVRSRVDPRVRYKFGNNRHNKRRRIFLKDAQHLIGQVGRDNVPMWQIVTGAKMEDMDPQAALGRTLAG